MERPQTAEQMCRGRIQRGAEATRTHALNMSSIYCFGVFVRFTQSRAP